MRRIMLSLAALCPGLKVFQHSAGQSRQRPIDAASVAETPYRMPHN